MSTARPALSVVIIVRNEEARIARCLESVLWADEIVVVDTGSTDRTLDIAGGYPCRAMSTAWQGFGLTKRYAVAQAAHDWILSLDADEVVTGELAASIRDTLARSPAHRAFRMRRRSFYLGTEIRFSGWQSDRPVRLFDRRSCTFDQRPVHESVAVTGTVGDLDGAALHYPYPTVSVHLAKMERYATLGAQVLLDRGRTNTIAGAAARGLAKFVKMFVLRGGFLDGTAGLILALNSSFGVYLKYLKLWELTHRRRST